MELYLDQHCHYLITFQSGFWTTQLNEEHFIYIKMQAWHTAIILSYLSCDIWTELDPGFLFQNLIHKWQNTGYSKHTQHVSYKHFSPIDIESFPWSKWVYPGRKTGLDLLLPKHWNCSPASLSCFWLLEQRPGRTGTGANLSWALLGLSSGAFPPFPNKWTLSSTAI